MPPETPPKIIETLGAHPGEGPRRLSAHLDRMARTAAVLGYPFERIRAEALLDLTPEAPLRCRLTLDPAGELDLTTAPLGPNPSEWRVAIHPERLDADDPWLRRKTTRRALYDDARADLPDGVDEWLFLNRAGEVCEGTITNLFAGEATPALSCGLLPGVLRAALLGRGWREAVLHPGDLDGVGFCMGNSLRGLIPARLVAA
ncbi:aminotransferase class IV family protein [Limimaricola hongkongensis]|uniref:Probable branched-chain-amino-acid aminotransferase n=1 Tax=Limimaricola hongkongensis DSM 17492 TaxID=1122180 RepID=A0A017HEL5_9RHOB|nr:aminotransferase class IV family protein [Limimaricola hongkongensis]EYD72239.1 Aminodeoxychorismate lyase [Limimaricola hongkongensis DSM 17492]